MTTTTLEQQLQQALDAAARAATPAAALAILDDARARTPALDDAAVLHHARANALAAVGRVDDAVAAADRACDLAPGVPDLVVNLAGALLLRYRGNNDAGDLARARRVLDDAVALGPRLPGVRATLAVVLERQGDAAAAVAVCDENLRLFPGDAPTLFNKAAALVALGRKDEAKALLSSLAPTFPPAAQALSRL